MTDTTDLRQELTRMTCELMRFRSTDDKPDQIVAVLDYAQAELAKAPGLRIERTESHGRPALMICLDDSRPPKVILNGHLDVVAAPDAQFEPVLKDGKIIGRGSQDMKGSVAALIQLMRDLAAWDNKPDIAAQIVTDEEIGGADGAERLLREGWKPELFVALEPTDLRLCNGHKGAMWIDVTYAGTSAHASRPWLGHNPVGALNDGLSRLAEHFPTVSSDAWKATVSPTLIHTGTNSRNRIPDVAGACIDIRFTENDSAQELIAGVSACFPGAAIEVDHPANPFVTDLNHPYSLAWKTAHAQVLGAPPATFKEHFGTDAGHYGAVGVPSLIYGPVGAGLHSDYEWVDIDSLVTLHRVLTAFASAEPR